MSDATQVSLEDFLANPDIHYYDFHELHNGEVVVESCPSEAHIELQQRLESLLQTVLSGAGYHVRREFYYTVESNSRRADVAVIRKARRDVGSSKVFRGGPELLIEILSPSNTAMDLDKLRSECFAEGTREFWQINPQMQTVTVFKGSGTVAVYRMHDRGISLGAFRDGAVLSTHAVFLNAL